MHYFRQRRATGFEHGRHIFVYANCKTNQVLYSLSRSLNPHHLKQFVYLGKDTVPSKIRRDMWYPFATLSFPSGHGGQGLLAFRKLREFRKRHEHEWTHEQLGTKNRKEAGIALMDQKANSVADMAYILLQQKSSWQSEHVKAEQDAEAQQKSLIDRRDRIVQVKSRMKELRNEDDGKAIEREEYKALKKEKIRLRKQMGATQVQLLPRRRYSMEGVAIAWHDPVDAEFAETWPSEVLHFQMPALSTRSRYAAPHPKSYKVPDAEPPEPKEPKGHSSAPDSGLSQLLKRLKFGSNALRAS